MSEEKKAYNIDKWRMQWAEYVARKKQQKEIKAFVDEAGELLKQLAGDAEVLSLGGNEVAKIVAGQLNKTRLAAEQPDLVQECTVTKIVERFDEALFRAKYPDIYKQYQARRLVVDPLIMGSIDE